MLLYDDTREISQIVGSDTKLVIEQIEPPHIPKPRSDPTTGIDNTDGLKLNFRNQQ